MREKDTIHLDNSINFQTKEIKDISEKVFWGRKRRKVSIATHKKENRKFLDHFS